MLHKQIVERGHAILISPEGHGKTRLSQSYVSKYGQSYTHILWISCRSIATITNSFAKIAAEIGIFVEQNDHKLLKDIASYFSNQRKYLVVIEDLNNEEAAHTLLRYFKSFAGDVIVTSRMESAISQFDFLAHLGQVAANSTESSEIDPADAKKSIETSKISQEDMIKLPLWTDQSKIAAFIAHTTSHLASLLQSEAERASLDKIGFKIPKTIVQAIELYEKTSMTSFAKLQSLQEELILKKKKIERGNSQAIFELIINEMMKTENVGLASRALISSFCFLQSDAVSKRLLHAISVKQKLRVILEIKHEERQQLMQQAIKSPPKKLESVIYGKQIDIKRPPPVKESIKFALVLQQLRFWSFFENSNDDDDTLTISVLVRKHSRSLAGHNLKEIITELIDAFISVLPDQEDTYQEGEQESALLILPHVLKFCKEVLDRTAKDSSLIIDSKVIIQILDRSSSVAQFSQKYLLQEELLQMKLVFLMKIHSSESLEIASVLSEIADCVAFIEKYNEALQMYQQCREIHNHIHGQSDNKVVLGLMSKCGDMNLAMGNYAIAKEAFSQYLETQIRLHGGKNHDDVAFGYENLGLVAIKENNMVKCLEYYQAAIDSRVNFSGEFHQSVAISYDQLANAYENFHDTPNAIKAHKKALELRKSMFKYHPSIAMTLNSIGMLKYSQEKYSKALGYCAKALRLYKIVHSHSHFSIARVLNNLGLINAALEDPEQARDLYLQSLDIKLVVYGTRCQEDVAKTLHNLGDLSKSQKDYKNATEYYEEALDTFTKLLGGRAHGHIATLLNNLGVLAREEADYARAVDLLNEALDIKVNLHQTRQNLSVSTTLHNLGEVALAQHDLVSARRYFEEALEIKLAFMEKASPPVVNECAKLSQVAYETGDYFTSYELAKEVYKSKSNYYGPQSQSAATALEALSAASLKLNKYDEALSSLSESYKIQIELSATDSIQAVLLKRIGDIHAHANSYSKAIETYQECLRLDSSDDITKLQLLSSLADMHDKTGNQKSAVVYYQRAFSLFQNVYPDIYSEDALPILKGLAKTSPEPLEWYVKLIEVHAKIFGRSSLEFALWLKIASKLYNDKQMYTESVGSFLEYASVVRKEAGITSPEAKESMIILNKLSISMKDAADKTHNMDIYRNIVRLMGDRRSLLVVECLLQLGITSASADESLDYYSKALVMHDGIQSNRQDDVVIEVLSHMASINILQGNQELAVQHYEESFDLSLALHSNRDQPQTKALENALANIADSYTKKAKEIQDGQELQRFCKNAIRIYEKLFGKTCEQAISIKDHLANSYFISKEYKLALQYYQESLDAARKLSAKDESLIAQKTQRLGQVCLALSDHYAALEYVNESWRLYKKRNANSFELSESTKLLHEIARLLEAAGKEEEVRENYIEGLKNFEDALEIRRRTSDNPNTVDSARLIASVGRMLVGKREYDDAKAKFNESLSIFVSIHGSRSDEQVAVLVSYLGKISEVNGDITGAIEQYTEAIDTLVHIDPSRSCEAFHGVAKNLTIFGLHLIKVGAKCETEGKLDTALANYKQAYLMLVKSYGTTDHHDVATALKAVAVFLLDQNNFEKALPKLQQLLVIQIAIEEETAETRNYVKEAQSEIDKIHSVFSCCLSKKKAVKIYPE